MEKTFIKYIGIEKLMDMYMANRDVVFFMFILACIIIFGASVMIVNEEAKETFENPLKNLVYILLAAVSGNIIYYTGFEVKFKSTYIPVLVGAMICIFVFVIYIGEIFKYVIGSANNKRKLCLNLLKITNRICQVFYYLVFAEVLFLGIINHLEMLEFAACYFVAVALKCLEKIFDFQIEKMFQDESDAKKLDIPVKHKNDLFEQRRKQLINVCKELNEIEKSPFAIMISGEWGSGKSSFLNVMMEEMENVEFIIIEGGMEIDIKNILNDIAIQISKVFEKNKFYIGKNSSIEKYFEYIGNMADGVGYSFAGDVLRGVKRGNTEGYEQNKKAINKELLKFYEVVQKKIFIVIDNLDRVKDEVRDKMFDVIRESINLNCCTTVFLVDQGKIRTNHISKEFIEKYINRHIELCPISCEEIFDEYYQEFSELKFESDYMNQRKKEIMTYMISEIEEIIENCKKELTKIQQEHNMATPEPKRKNIEERVKIWKNLIEKQEKRIKNPRKFKRFLFDNLGVMMSIADSVWFSDSVFEENLYSKLDWGKIIFHIAYLKSFLCEEYDVLLYTGSLKKLRDNHRTEYNKVSIVLGLGEEEFFSDKTELIELIVYNLYSLDSKLDKSKRQELLDELRYDRLQEENLYKYLKECLYLDKNNEYLKKIMEYTLNHTFKDQRIKKHMVWEITNKITSFNIRKIKNIDMIIGIIIKIIEDPEIHFSSGEIQSLKASEKEFKRRSVAELKRIIPIVLQVIFHVDSARTDVSPGSTSLEKLYDWLKEFNKEYPLDSNQEKHLFLELNWDFDPISSMRSYFHQMKLQLKNQEYDDIREELQEYFSSIDSILKCMERWDIHEENTNPIEEKISYLNWKQDMDYQSVIKDLFDKQDILETVKYLKQYIENESSVEKKVKCFMGMIDAVGMYLNEPFIRDRVVLLEVISLLKEIYAQLDKDESIKQNYGERWNRCKIDIFILERECKSTFHVAG